MYSTQTFYKDDNIDVELEEVPYEGTSYFFVHIKVTTFNKDVYKLVKEKWVEIKEYVKSKGHTLISAYTKNNRFAKRFGEPLAVETVTHMGEDYEVYVWRI